ncbi:hypothetical protein E0L36_22145 [Streptomyces sp. AJS327]|uniref:hypothetical protein n=1 Tax=Streptomyces sp. AJS327 TaxID=2545265 RepID=UPI0015DE8CD4|nr:hypothetical protein [Streptomyces sp. AJS327]MBA0053479.1 hypothetical protein [Streptomyces sp. AJS327]
MPDDDDTVAARPTLSLCDVVRITPYREGEPDHRQACTTWFPQPVTLVYAHRASLPPFGTLTAPRGRNVPPLVGFALSDESVAFPEAEAGVERLWQHRATGASVDLWSWAAPGTWVYSLVVEWRPMPLEGWPLAIEGQDVLAGGSAHASRGRYAWPTPPPIPNPHDVDPDVHFVLSTEASGPPVHPCAASFWCSC